MRAKWLPTSPWYIEIMCQRVRSAAYCLVWKAVAAGQLSVSATCEKCGRPAAPGNSVGTHRVIAHHENYSKPLDVIWLCFSCHYARHKDLKCYDDVIAVGEMLGLRQFDDCRLPHGYIEKQLRAMGLLQPFVGPEP